ncbi:putrescine-ornithine antiporter [Salmonella enterica]|uniref:Putrescine transporter PotE n=2 Tax=Salmonella enterica TaxID=28901 RepID=A0A619HY24_SALER|nr:putrescine-ornithine antiporter [Salmonella enterica subsp. enterica serovar Java]EAN9729281.1 putrescine-ornithine antiporter [Salmonella enterica]EBV8394732.1 putrescine-ornithine antiporter [Salmonella enterica subsp. enterica serovar Virchow]EDQ0183611.1 putrescine-ornithine antiporter [Salmonella enterica subsp. enterica serovar 4,[5],12:b:-]EDV9614007.1 putrescine-ornithine antiporter [Salmonella enterica subsp. enterica serovar Paratyphi B]EEE5613235.1 putrescine-ornithine antiporter
MSENSESNKLGVTQLTILTAVNMMGSGIIMLPTKLASVGTMSVLSWLVTAVGSLCLAYAFAKCGMFSRKPGGMGGYAEYAFGKSGNFMANFTYAISLVIANIAIAISAVGYGSVLFDWHPTPVMTCVATIIVIWVTTVANFGGPRITGRIGAVTVWGVIAPVVVISVMGWFWFSPHLYATSWNPHHVPFTTGLTTSIAMTLWAFLGLESACANSDAVEEPEKNVPIAVFGGTLLCAVVYIASTNVMAGFVPNTELANSTAPFGLAFAHMFTPFVGKIVMALMVIACIGSLLGWQFTVAQVFKSSSDIGYFPGIFSKVTSKDAPVVGMIILGVVQTILALMTISPSLNEQFNNLVNLAVVTNLIPYILSMAALIPLQRLYSVTSLAQKAIYITAIIGTVYSFYALYASGSDAMLAGSLVTFAGWSFYGLFVRDANTCPKTESGTSH